MSEQFPEPPFQIHNEIDKGRRQNGFLSPQGAFIICDSDEHDACAEYIVSSNKKYFEEQFGQDIEGLNSRTILAKAGYIKIAGPYPDFFNISDRLNETQYQILKEAGYQIPKDLDLDPTTFLPQKEELIKELSTHFSIPALKDILDPFYRNPFNGFRTENLGMAMQVYDALSRSSTEEEMYKSRESWGVIELILRKYGAGDVALAHELYQHEGRSVIDYGAAEQNATVYVNTPGYIRNRIPDASKV